MTNNTRLLLVPYSIQPDHILTNRIHELNPIFSPYESFQRAFDRIQQI